MAKRNKVVCEQCKEALYLSAKVDMDDPSEVQDILIDEGWLFGHDAFGRLLIFCSPECRMHWENS